MTEELRKNDADRHYELVVDGDVVGHIEWVDEGDVIDLPHTIVDPAHGGKGYGGLLAKYALDDVRAQGKKARPTCPFIARYIDRHPDYGDVRAD
ncbi:GNAT family N-acetyltransferase [Tessaracoccus caeni]|uniref:GNAT family N-acetyltransferase n=1 Tax=Tessaracoccus caeni TaxID=3031239 RepID=UPI0023DA42ED|nr:GNAT family N-acetyltransferase [Tessaracoccus caeni]MDF1488470.1 GNAT family N-acetyltransferase [Tessaracoccus caeni]